MAKEKSTPKSKQSNPLVGRQAQPTTLDSTTTLDIDTKEVYKARQDHTDNILYLTDENKEVYNFKNINKSNWS